MLYFILVFSLFTHVIGNGEVADNDNYKNYDINNAQFVEEKEAGFDYAGDQGEQGGQGYFDRLPGYNEWYEDTMQDNDDDWEDESSRDEPEDSISDDDMMPAMDMDKTTFFSDVLKYQPMTEEDFRIKDKFMNNTDSNQIAAYSQALRDYLRDFKCIHDCSAFDPRFLSETKQLVKKLKTLEPINGVSVENKGENLALILGGLQGEFGKLFFQRVMYGATLQRNDTKDVRLPENALEIQSELLLPNTENLGEDYQNSIQNNNGVITDADFQRNSPAQGTPEALLDYWRECLSLHNFHTIWHNINTARIPIVRQSERFKYMHQQIMNRYRMEREAMNVPPVQPMSIQNMFAPFSSVYSNLQFQPTFNPNKQTCLLNGTIVNRIQTVQQQNTNFLARAGSMERYFNIIENNVHALGHIQIGADCVNANNQSTGFMGNPGASARDPLFYRWHAEVENYLLLYYQNSPYTAAELAPAAGIQVTGLRLQSRCGRPNNFQNYYTLVGTKNASNPDPLLGKTLQTDTFKITIRIQNSARAVKNVIIRIFAIGENHYKFGRNFIELDRWVLKLSGAPKQDIVRFSSENSMTYQRGNPSCAWPYDLYLPRGGIKGPSKYRLVVFVHDPTSSSVNEGINQNHKPFMYCGSDKIFTVFDGRNFGFPLDKAWQGIDIGNLIDKGDRQFGVVGQKVTIQFTGTKPSCGVADVIPLTVNTTQGLGVCTKVRNRPCVFPFIYQGVIYNRCTNANSPVRWCAVEVYDDGQVQFRSECINCASSNSFNTVQDLTQPVLQFSSGLRPTPPPIVTTSFSQIVTNGLNTVFSIPRRLISSI